MIAAPRHSFMSTTDLSRSSLRIRPTVSSSSGSAFTGQPMTIAADRNLKAIGTAVCGKRARLLQRCGRLKHRQEHVNASVEWNDRNTKCNLVTVENVK